MNPIRKAAEIYIKNGIKVIPTENKQAIVSDWGKYIVSDIDLSLFNGANELAMLMGGKFNLTCIDVDEKYDLSGNLFESLKNKLGSVVNKMRINMTRNGGKHLIFSCKNICEGNLKLANRPTTDAEKRAYFDKMMSLGKTFEESAMASLAHKSVVLIETRGRGGYIIAPPSNGYYKLSGEIGILTLEEYNFVIDTCRSFNTFVKPTRPHTYDSSISAKIKKFNADNNTLDILKRFGWEESGVNNRGYVMLKRPGADSDHSAYYNKEDGGFWVKSTSTIFDVDKRYTPFDIILLLKYNGDFNYANEVFNF